MNGKLYVIGTPIGNLQDITIRALETINRLDVLVCEDSRVTARLINHYLELGKLSKRPPYFVCNEFNESKVAPQIVEMVRSGSQVGLVSDAGMPILSDPGFRVVRGVLNEGLSLEVIPGVSSLTTAIAMSGVGGEVVLYAGFLPKKRGKRTELLQTIKLLLEKLDSSKIVIFPSPHRLHKELTEIGSIIGDVQAVLLRELTKKFEDRTEGTVGDLIEKYKEAKPKGELVLIITNGRT